MLYRSLGGLVVVIIHSFIVYLLSLRLEKLVYAAGVGTTNQHMCGVGTVDVEGMVFIGYRSLPLTTRMT
jgi:hypothetical protein